MSRKCFINKYGIGIRVSFDKPVKTEAGIEIDAIVFNQPNPEDASHNAYFTDDKNIIKAIKAHPRFIGNKESTLPKHIYLAKTKEDIEAEIIAKKQSEALQTIKENLEAGLFTLPDSKLPADKLFKLAEKIGVPTKRDGKKIDKVTVLKNVIDLITN